MNLGKLGKALTILDRNIADTVGQVDVEVKDDCFTIYANTSDVGLEYKVRALEIDADRVSVDMKSFRAMCGVGTCHADLSDRLVVTDDQCEATISTSEAIAIDAPWESETEAIPRSLSDRNDLADKLTFILRAISREADRVALASAAFGGSRGISATDGHRLHWVEFDAEPSEQRLIPFNVVDLLLRCLKFDSTVPTVAIQWGAKSVLFSVGNWQISSVYTDARFPPIENVIPSNFEADPKFNFDSKRFTKALKKLSKINNRIVYYEANGTVLFKAENSAGGSISVDLKTTPTRSPEYTPRGVCPRYVIEALAGESGAMYLPDDVMSAIVIEHSIGHAVVMPMRL